MKTFLLILLFLAPFARAIPPRPEAPKPLASDSIDTLIHKAHQAEELRDLETARQCWTLILQRRPGDATVLYNRAQDYDIDIENDGGNANERADAASAIADLTDAIRINPKYVEAYLSRASIYLQQRHETKAIDDYNEAIRIDPKNLKSYQDLASIYDGEGERVKALAVYGDAVTANRENIDAYWNRGWYCVSYFNDKAIADFSEVIRRDPKLAKAYDARARAYANQGQWDNVIADFTSEIDLGVADSNSSSSPYKARADAYAKKKQWDKAKADLDKLIASEDGSEPDDVDYDAYVARADTLRAKGDYAKALIDYSIAIHSQGADQADRDTAHMGRGETYWAMGQKDKAIADFTRAVETHLYGNDCVRLARAEFDLGQFDKAIAHCTLGIVRCEEGFDAHLLRGAAHAARGDEKLAAQNFRDALSDAITACTRSKWKDPGDIVSLATIESRLGRFDMAARHQQMAIDLARAGKSIDEKTLQAMAARLALYQQGKPWIAERQPIDPAPGDDLDSR